MHAGMLHHYTKNWNCILILEQKPKKYAVYFFNLKLEISISNLNLSFSSIQSAFRLIEHLTASSVSSRDR